MQPDDKFVSTHPSLFVRVNPPSKRSHVHTLNTEGLPRDQLADPNRKDCKADDHWSHNFTGTNPTSTKVLELSRAAVGVNFGISPGYRSEEEIWGIPSGQVGCNSRCEQVSSFRWEPFLNSSKYSCPSLSAVNTPLGKIFQYHRDPERCGPFSFLYPRTPLRPRRSVSSAKALDKGRRAKNAHQQHFIICLMFFGSENLKKFRILDFRKA